MMQTKLQSFLESAANTGSGFLVSYLVSIIIFPWFGIPVSMGQNFLITCIFTITSLARSFAWRRYFNSKEKPTLSRSLR